MDFEQIMDVASYAMLIIVSLVAFSMLLKYVVPTLTLRVNHFVDKSLGRGIKTYKYRIHFPSICQPCKGTIR